MVDATAPALTVGLGFTAIVILSLLGQPAALLVDTVYTTVVVGFASTVSPAVLFKPVAGNHV